ncbi:unnamed protein product [Rotaria sordida]|uniref:RBR-type E3 ubiquitin transferase n=2 Tax=Rotaria sordida TaxID=392033 RepID=A0A814VK76_9BILA|nr:unnamed protein product [Rotaria sordida]CAF1189373.1 unnamed protein product [Rotaria sordida]
MVTQNCQQKLPFTEAFDVFSSSNRQSNHAADVNRSCQINTFSETSLPQPPLNQQQLKPPSAILESQMLQLNDDQLNNRISLSQITRECAVCSMDKPYSEFIGNYSEACRHLERTVCDACVYENTKFLVENTSIYDEQLICPEQNCNATFDFYAIRGILLATGKSHIVFEKYDKNLIYRRLEQMTEFVWCAHECGSGQLHDLEGFSSPEVICIKCQLRTCFTHRTIWHTGITCAEYDLQQSQLPDDGTCAWLDQNTKRCPQCRWYIEKNAGCNEMKCRRCHHKFCWECQADYRIISREGKSNHRSWCSHYKPKPVNTTDQHQTQRWCNVQ